MGLEPRWNAGWREPLEVKRKMRKRRQLPAQGSGVALEVSVVQSRRCHGAAVVIEELRLSFGEKAESVL